jgi:predicted nucleic acid-binding protein
MTRFSLDANVLVYAADSRAGQRHTRALHILVAAARRDCVLTLQALGEFFHTAACKRIVPRRDAAEQVRDLLDIFRTVTADGAAFRAALDWAERGTRSFWDGVLIATLASAGCEVLLSEDMQDGARFGGVTVLDPFVGDELPEVVAALLR